MPHTLMLERVRAEYLEMPGLRLTLPQAQRLCGLERELCRSILQALVEAKFLCVKSDGTYARVTDDQLHRPYAAKAQLSNPARRALTAS